MLLLEDIKKSIRVTAHYTVHIGIAPSFQTDRETRKYHYQRYASLPHATAALFARHSSLTALTSIPDFSIPSYALPHKNRSRQLLACPHSGSAHPTRPVCICIFNYQGTLRQKILRLIWIKSFLDLPAQKAHKHSPSAMNGSVKIMCFSGMASLQFQFIGAVFMYNLQQDSLL